MPNTEQKIEDFKIWYAKQLPYHQQAIEAYTKIISTIPKVVSVSARVKSLDECISKFKRKYLPDLDINSSCQIQDLLNDIIGVRAICFYSEEVESIKKSIKKYFRISEITDKSSQLERTDDKFGYKSLHLQLVLKNRKEASNYSSDFRSLQFELQIRTVIQDAWSILDHKIKYKKSIPQNLKRRINRLSALFEIADDEFLSIKNEIALEEKKIKDRIRKGSSIEKNQTLDVFRFLFIAHKYFPDYTFIEFKIDGFVQEILNLNKGFTEGDLDNALKQYLNISDSIEKNGKQYLNPYTKIRYCLYQFNNKKFAKILSTYQVEKIKAYL